ncbi:DUF1579 family protein [Kordiimonas sp. SCSIO 12610]|uniref:DUF1579 family protein n=1 Tax=Kordiimonas sp. SCSIO 12610 TaxID=2829597 RepID=UPI00210AED4F|nr:DUF1579 family protein [Kordiimonas sp. SCSIO 12610]UTW54665.1 DUF1579 family protein [Kordiimonas sp. SCSIO 12610]
MKILWTVGMVFFAVMSKPVFAFEDSAVRPAISEKPYTMMQKLNSLAGQWQMETKVSMDGGKTWTSAPKNRVTIQYDHKDMVISEKPVKAANGGFNMLSFITYDQYRDVYRKAAIDDVWGIMDIYEGKIHGDKLVMTNLKSQTLFPLEDGKWRGFRLTLELKSDLRQMTVESTDDNGESWSPNFVITYTKVS